MATDLGSLIEPVARALLGEPNRAQSSKTELRFGTHGSVSVDLIKGTYYDHEAQEGGGTLALIEARLGLHGRECFEWMRGIGLQIEDDLPPPRANGQKKGNGPLGREVAHYDYVDEAGNFLSQKVRFEPKTFRQRRRARLDDDPRIVHHGWVYNVGDVRRVPYRLPELIESVATGAIIFLVEGEKDVDNLYGQGLRATCNPGGAGKWRQDDIDDCFTDADIVVIQDNDPQARKKDGTLLFHPDGRPRYPGQDHAREACECLASVARRVRLLDLTIDWPGLPKKGDVTDWFDHGGTIEHLYEIAEIAPDWSPELPGPEPESSIQAWRPTSTYRDPATIPPRIFLYSRQYIRGAVSTTVAAGGTGKTNLAVAEAIAIATGRDILGVGARAPINVLLWNGEESLDEIERRVHAVCQHFNIDPQKELTGRLHMMSGLSDPLVVAVMIHGAAVFNEAALATLEQTIVQCKIGVTILDPFVSSHRIPENDNTNIDAVVKRFMAITYRTQTSIELVHHTRKTSGEFDMAVADARGASALINAARAARVLNRMTAAQARTAGVRDYREYFRADNGKANYAPEAMATWFHTVPKILANGDSVAALEPFTFPGSFDDVRPDHIETVKAALRCGGPYRFDTQSPEWVGRVVAEVVGLDPEDESDKKKLKDIINTWIKNGILFKRSAKDEKRRERMYVFADAEERDNVVPFKKGDDEDDN